MGDRPKVGIGIATYNRAALLDRTLRNVISQTAPGVEIVVADDGSTDETRDVVFSHAAGLTGLIDGANQGVGWNKNRLLFFLSEIRRADIVIILEDDSYPVEKNWEAPWVEAARRYGHACYAAPWFAQSFDAGEGTVENPYLSHNATGQCTSFSREALAYVGYIDPRFGKKGAEHVEHSMRMVRAGFGGIPGDSGFISPFYYLISSQLVVNDAPSHFTDPDAKAEAVRLVFEYFQGSLYRAPWDSDAAYHAFRSEMQNATLFS